MLHALLGYVKWITVLVFVSKGDVSEKNPRTTIIELASVLVVF